MTALYTSGKPMFQSLAKAIFGSSNDRYVKSLDKIVQKIAAYEPIMQAMSDEEIAGQTVKFREILANGGTLDEIMPGLCHRARGVVPFHGHAPFRRADDRRHRAAPWRDRRNAHG
jgi:hypothetical protein